AVGVDQAGQHPVVLAVLEQRARIDVRVVRILRRLAEPALFGKLTALLLRQLRLDQFGGEVRRRRDQQKAGEAIALAGRVQFLYPTERDPAAHRGADEDLAAAGEMPKDRKAFREPARNRAVGEFAA